MASRIRHLTIDCTDPYELGLFWSQALGVLVADDDEPGDPEALVDPGDGPPLLFVWVPDKKVAKNRLHLDLQPSDRSRDAEVERLASLGATVAADHRRGDGTGWVTMADPEGNEFLRRDELRGAGSPDRTDRGHDAEDLTTDLAAHVDAVAPMPRLQWSTRPSQDQCGIVNPAGTSSADS